MKAMHSAKVAVCTSRCQRLILTLFFRLIQVEKGIEDWIEEKVIKHSDTKYVFETPSSTASNVLSVQTPILMYTGPQVQQSLLAAHQHTVLPI